ncbi:hypothetical protein D9M68_938340 [compost metagenome]
MALVLAIVDLARPRRHAAGLGRYFIVLLATWVVGFFNALMHARDAWAAMPTGLVLSIVGFILAFIATWLGFASSRTGGAA